MSWKKLGTNKLLDHPRLQIYEDDVALPSGSQTKYLYFKGRPHASQVIVIGNGNKVLIQKEYSYPPNEWLFQFPGGGLQQDESPLQGAKRELAEETKLSGSLEEIGWFYVDNRRENSKFHVFVATNVGEIEADSDEEEEFENFWFTKDEINQKSTDGEIVNYSMLAAWAMSINSPYYKDI